MTLHMSLRAPERCVAIPEIAEPVPEGKRGIPHRDCFVATLLATTEGKTLLATTEGKTLLATTEGKTLLATTEGEMLLAMK
jgi:hypothetical protein